MEALFKRGVEHRLEVRVVALFAVKLALDNEVVSLNLRSAGDHLDLLGRCS